MDERLRTAAVLAALANEQELPGPVLRERAGMSENDFYALILQLEANLQVKSRWAEGTSPMVRLYRLADVKLSSGG
jgi:hypothetical protein